MDKFIKIVRITVSVGEAILAVAGSIKYIKNIL